MTESPVSGNQSDLFVLGCGRSGTSLVAGLFRNAGFFMGRQLHAPRPSNPKGFFEDATINRLNDGIIARLLPSRGEGWPAGYGFDIPDDRHRWLARVDLSHPAWATPDEIGRIAELTGCKPFCFKDPRFCYTLDLWRSYANRPKFICVFRHPGTFVASVFTECLAAPYLHGFAVSVRQLFDVWVCMYRQVLDRHSRSGDWLFVEYDDLVSGADIDRIRCFTDVGIDLDFADPTLSRSPTVPDVPKDTLLVLDELRARKNVRQP